MATAKNWRGEEARFEQCSPVPPFSKYVAIRNFPGQQKHDLSFSIGDIITVLEPCNVVFWYLGENSSGKRGVIPINFLKPYKSSPPISSGFVPPPLPPKDVDLVPPLPPKPAPSSESTLSPTSTLYHQTASQHPSENLPTSSTSLTFQPPPFPTLVQAQTYRDIDSRPPAPLPPEASPTPKSPLPLRSSKYHSQTEFMRKSGWFSPNLENVLCRKMGNAQYSAVNAKMPGVYYFFHREHKTKGYTGKSNNAFQDLLQMFNSLYDKPEEKLNPLEEELKYNLPDANGWCVRLLSVGNAVSLNCTESWSIVIHRTLQPEGLNSNLSFLSREQFDEFAEMYAKKLREKKGREGK